MMAWCDMEQMAFMMTPPATYWLGWLSFFSFSAQSTTGGYCVVPLTPHQQILLSVLMPFVFMAQLGERSILIQNPFTES
jgi:hypothetical protein